MKKYFLPSLLASLAAFSISSAQVTSINKVCTFADFGPNAVVLGIGQSNMSRVFYSADGVVAKEFAAKLKQEGGFSSVKFIPSAFGGSPLDKKVLNSSQLEYIDYWVDTTNPNKLQHGPAMRETLRTVKANKKDLDLVLFNQGEADAQFLPHRTSKAEYKENLKFVIRFIRLYADNPNLPFGIVSLGRRTNANGMISGYQEVREAQQEVVREMDNVFIVGSGYDLPLADTVHLETNSYRKLYNERVMSTVLGCLGKKEAVIHPILKNVKVSADEKSMTAEVVGNNVDLAIESQAVKNLSLRDAYGVSRATVLSVTKTAPNQFKMDISKNRNFTTWDDIYLHIGFANMNDYRPGISGIYADTAKNLPLISNKFIIRK